MSGNYFGRVSDGRLIWDMVVSAIRQKSSQQIRLMGLKNIKVHLPDMVHDLEKIESLLIMLGPG